MCRASPLPRRERLAPGRAPRVGRGRLSFTLAVILLLVGTGPGAKGAEAQTTTLRGELLQRDGQPAIDIRLVVVGHPPEVSLQDGALFSHALSGTPSEVTIRVVGHPTAEVLFPPGGRVVIPGDPSAVVSVVVGERIGVAVEERIERDLQAIRETLEVRGVSKPEIEAVLRSEMEGLVARIATLTEGAVETAVAGAAQTELRERINRHLGTYVRRSRDLVDAFGLVGLTDRLSLHEQVVLRDAIGNYSQAFEELDRELSEAPAALERAWPGETGLRLRDRMAGMMELIRTEVHQSMLDLREPLVVIQLDFTPDRPSRNAVRAAWQTVVEAMPRLHDAQERLEAEVPPLMEALRAPAAS
jgi:hypothetical protein